MVNVFPTIVSGAKYFYLDHNILSKCIKSVNLINNYRFIGELKDLRV